MRYHALLLLPIVLSLGLSSCEKSGSISTEQEQRLNEKIDLLNKRLNNLEDTGEELKTVNSALKEIKEYKKEACILNIRNIHQAIRSHQGLNGLNVGAAINWENIFGKDKYMEIKPQCPHHGDYILMKIMPKVGEVAAKCPHADTLGHKPGDHEGW